MILKILALFITLTLCIGQVLDFLYDLSPLVNVGFTIL